MICEPTISTIGYLYQNLLNGDLIEMDKLSVIIDGKVIGEIVTKGKYNNVSEYIAHGAIDDALNNQDVLIEAILVK